MKLIAAIAAFTAVAQGFSTPTRLHEPDYYTQMFNDWKKLHNKTYATVEEEAAALSKFADNDEKIEHHNSQRLSYWLGHNQFSDMTGEEFHSTYVTGMLRSDKERQPSVMLKTDASTAPDSLDWVTKGAVTPVKNQGQCGSCWAFSTTGSMEGAYQIAEGKLVSFSEEDLVQCDTVDQGCNGGLMDNAFKFIQGNGGIAAESAYPYTSGTGTRGTCKAGAVPVATNSGHKDVPSKDEEALKEAVALGPVSVAIEADKSAFQLYKGGILDSPNCGTQLDHGVLTVGYGTSSGTDYWKVKNSWGATWGESGYLRMARGKNMCGIAQQPSYPTGVKSVGPGPAPGPGPSPPPPAPTGTHYGDPKVGCESDETSVQIQGVTGDFCSPPCTGIFKMTCPKDVPAGVTATPTCALQDASSGAKYCALTCSATLPIVDQKAADAVCGTNASCKAVQAGVGICTYND